METTTLKHYNHAFIIFDQVQLNVGGFMEDSGQQSRGLHVSEQVKQPT